MKFIFFVLLISYEFKGLTQDTDWQKTSDWKLYDLADESVFRVSADSLTFFKSIALNSDSMRYYLGKAIEMPKERNPSWMGAWVTSCDGGDHSLHKIDISMYGGFFYDEHEKRYFELSKGIRPSWMKYLNKAAEKLNQH